ncbi:phospholipid phosphatase homolog 1.2 homolog [Colias croceus]|uniref:phospholipid phosphatase homolog 1.2 homolog n=1 Tax=Colias crocea TaxID=72248 RepID=UPI001E27B890|nr:phospholipid phosphatase homolog 1.2 homolog [Colias croceus]
MKGFPCELVWNYSFKFRLFYIMNVHAVKMWRNLKVLWSKTNRWHIALFIFAVAELNLIPGGQVGFQCNDPALSHPYTGDTVNWKWLMVTTIFLPLAVLLLVERKQCPEDTAKHQALFWYREYLFGFLLNLTIVQTLKLIVGSPRPHFFDTCGPQEATTCVESDYVPSYTCTKAHWLKQSNKSFPSGHTSLAIHAGVFIAYYLYKRGQSLPGRMTRTIQGVCIVAAIVCSVSRVWDRRHHWWDVLAGAVLAAPVLVYTIRTLCMNFACKQPDEQKDGETTDTHNGIVNKS